MIQSFPNISPQEESHPQEHRLLKQQQRQRISQNSASVSTSSGFTHDVSTSRSPQPLSLSSESITASPASAQSLSKLPSLSPQPIDKLICTSYCDLSSGSSCISWYSAALQSQQIALLRQPAHLVPSHQIPDPSPLSIAYTKFLQTVDQMTQSGIPIDSILEGIDPKVDLLFRPRSQLDTLTPATWACEITKRFMPFDLYTQLGYVFLLSRLIRWTLCPKLENWILLPSIMKPTALQRSVPHYPTADMQPLPIIRESMVRGEHTLQKPVGDVKRAGTQSIKLHWPLDIEAALENSTTGETVLSRLFMAAAADEDSWSCGVAYFQEISSKVYRGVYNVIVHDHAWKNA